MNELKHLAIIMDGNGRWAKQQGLLRSFGHKAGAKNLEQLVSACIDNNISNLSLFAFSTENWKRPKDEIEFIFKLLKEYLINLKDDFIKNDIRFKTFGNIAVLDDGLRKLIDEFEKATKHCAKLNFNLGINYGAKDEIVRAANKLIKNNESITEESLSKALDLSLDVDLLIRTGGHYRISNFLLWQCAYAQMVFTTTLFPDFSKDELLKIIDEFKKCQRNYGGL